MKRSNKTSTATEVKKVRRVSTDRKTAAAAPPRAKPPEPTVIVADIDVGFGNRLYIRGDGPGMNWNEGVPMNCVADDRWSFTVDGAVRPIAFKFCLNNATWCTGEDYTIAPGEQRTFSPQF